MNWRRLRATLLVATAVCALLVATASAAIDYWQGSKRTVSLDGLSFVKVLDDPKLAGVGASVFGGADLDGDGYDEALIGAPGVSGPTGPTGAVAIVHGYTTPWPNNDPGPPIEQRPLQIIGSPDFGRFGASVAALKSKANGERKFLIAVGSPAKNGAAGQSGTVYLFKPDLPDPIAQINGPAGEPSFGSTLAVGRDSNRDGTQDLAIGSPGQSRAYLLRQIPIGSSLEVSTCEQCTLVSGRDGDRVGAALEFGRWGPDRIQDLMIGAPGASPRGRTKAGAVFVLLGGGNKRSVNTRELLQIAGSRSREAIGQSIAAIDDSYASDEWILSHGPQRRLRGPSFIYLIKPSKSQSQKDFDLRRRNIARRMSGTGRSASNVAAVEYRFFLGTPGLPAAKRSPVVFDVATGSAKRLQLRKQGMPIAGPGGMRSVVIGDAGHFNGSGGIKDLLVGLPGHNNVAGAAYVLSGWDLLPDTKYETSDPCTTTWDEFYRDDTDPACADW